MEYLDFLDSKVMALLNTVLIAVIGWMATAMWKGIKEKEKETQESIKTVYKQLGVQNDKFNSIMSMAKTNQKIIQMNQEAMLRQGDTIADLQKEINAQYKLILQKK